MRICLPLIGVLLAAPLLAEELSKSEAGWLLAAETREQVAKALGDPAMVADFGTDFRSWQFQVGDVDHHDFSHQVVYRKSNGKLVSIARNFEPEISVDSLFPEVETTVYSFPAGAAKPQYSLRLRRLAGGRVLMAMGVSKPGQATSQILLMMESELGRFYPWVAEQMK